MGQAWLHPISRVPSRSELWTRRRMGACGSKGISHQSSLTASRELSRWKADSNDCGDSLVQHQATDITLNTVIAYPEPAGDFPSTLCVTGWEDGVLRLNNWKTKAIVKEFGVHSRAVNCVEVGYRSGNLYSCSRDTTVSILRRTSITGATQASDHPTLRGHTLNVSAICVNDDETSLCSGGRDTQTIMWDLTTATCKARNTTAQNVITCSKWIPGDRIVAQGSEDLSIKMWDDRNGLRTPIQMLRGYMYFPLCIDVSPEGHYLLTSSKGFNGVGCEARVWDRRTGRQLLQYNGHQQDATACCFVPSLGTSTVDIPTPVTASKDGTLKIWDSASSQLLCESREPLGQMFTSLSTTLEGIILASTFHGNLHAFQLQDDRKSVQFQH